MYRTSISTIGFVLPFVVISAAGCNKDETPPPPLPSAAAPAESVPTLEMEPLPDPVVDAGTTAKPVGKGRPASSMQACCNALMQNAASAPEPTATYMKQAAATCSSLAEQGKDKASIIGILQAAMRGAGLPAACR